MNIKQFLKRRHKNRIDNIKMTGLRSNIAFIRVNNMFLKKSQIVFNMCICQKQLKFQQEHFLSSFIH